MTRKHFIAIAADFKAVLNVNPELTDAIRELASSQADLFKSINPNFDRARFMEACGF